MCWRFLLLWLLVAPAWSQPALRPRLLALKRVPKGTLNVWVHGQFYGIDGLWSYNDKVESRNWCWWGPGRTSYQPLAREQYIVRVNGKTLSAIYQDPDDYQKCHLWQRGKDGRFYDSSIPYTRRYGSDVGREFVQHVWLPGYGQFYEIFEKGVLLRRTGQPSDRPVILCKREIKGISTVDDVLAMQPRQHRVLALGMRKQLLLLSPDLKTLCKLPLGEVRNLRFDENGKRLALLTQDDRVWILELFPQAGPVIDPRADLKEEEFERLAQEWERRTGRSWWDPAQPAKPLQI